MRTALRILISPLWALALVALLAFTLATLVLTRAWAVVSPSSPVGAVSSTSDRPFIMALVGKAITLGLAIASAIVGYDVGAPAWTDGLPLLVATVVIAVIHRNYSANAQASYAAELGAGVVQPNALPVGVGAGPPPIGPEREDVPRGAVPGPGEAPSAASRQ